MKTEIPSIQQYQAIKPYGLIAASGRVAARMLPVAAPAATDHFKKLVKPIIDCEQLSMGKHIDSDQLEANLEMVTAIRTLVCNESSLGSFVGQAFDAIEKSAKINCFFSKNFTGQGAQHLDSFAELAVQVRDSTIIGKAVNKDLEAEFLSPIESVFTFEKRYTQEAIRDVVWLRELTTSSIKSSLSQSDLETTPLWSTGAPGYWLPLKGDAVLADIVTKIRAHTSDRAWKLQNICLLVDRITSCYPMVISSAILGGSASWAANGNFGLGRY